MKRSITLLFCGVAFGLTSNAAVIFTLGNNPQPNENNVLLNTGATGNVVFGNFNSANVAYDARFQSTQTITEPANGQARIEALSGGLTNLTMSLFSNGGAITFGDIIFNAHIGGTVGTTGSSTVTVVSTAGTTQYSLPLGNGENFATIVATGPDRLISATFNATGGASATDIRQVRISGPFGNLVSDVPGVPEPASFLLIGGGLAVAGLYRKRKQRTSR